MNEKNIKPSIYIKVIFPITVFFQLSFSFLSFAYEWVDVYSKNEICERLDINRVQNSFTLWAKRVGGDMWTSRPAQRNRILIPKLPITIKFGLTVEMVIDDNPAYLAIRYSTPPGDYPASAKVDDNPTIFTHINPKSSEFPSLTDIKEKDAVIAFINRWNSTMMILHHSQPSLNDAGDYLYLNLFGNRQRVFNLVFLLTLNTQEAIKWCQPKTNSLSSPKSLKLK